MLGGCSATSSGGGFGQPPASSDVPTVSFHDIGELGRHGLALPSDLVPHGFVRHSAWVDLTALQRIHDDIEDSAVKHLPLASRSFPNATAVAAAPLVPSPSVIASSFID